ncbi:MAG: alanine--tRNA ligase [Patescibacteria group bacterium]|nr:alanine--tRNA ligase [Patescibacteria group bacterium]
MTAEELRQKYIEFFRGREHAFIPSASLVPENDPTVLFTTAGMHPLVPFLMGEDHPAGTRLVDYQRCLRTSDIDLVGDDHHLTFFEMLGNWSLGDYFKTEAIEWSWEFLTDKKWLGLDPERISVSVFGGDEDAARDEESSGIWESVGVSKERIYFYGKKDNWWGPAGQTGPCGPDTEMFYDTGKGCSLGRGDECEPNCGCGRFVEIWNDVFMEYNKTAEGKFLPLDQRNVDTGMGIERTLQVINGLDSVYQTELFEPLITIINNLSQIKDTMAERVVADHVKAAVFIIADGIQPSNVERGYIVRRLIRRAYRYSLQLGITDDIFAPLAEKVIQIYGRVYPHLVEKRDFIFENLKNEKEKFAQTLNQGLRIMQKELSLKERGAFPGKVAFDLYQTYGFPKELIEEELQRHSVTLNDEEWREAEIAHRELSRQGAEKKFAGGLADHSERVIKMHTATHLLHRALGEVLGEEVQQKGSNITEERLRFDFSYPKKVTSDELRRIEEIVNEKIAAGIPVEKRILPIEEARKIGAIGLFGEKYGDKVSIYLIGDFSKEICGGPHVSNTKLVGKFKILKEEASSAGVRRIKAVVE